MKECPICKNKQIRHKGKKVTMYIPSESGAVIINQKTYRVSREWNKQGYICKKCGWDC